MKKNLFLFFLSFLIFQIQPAYSICCSEDSDNILANDIEKVLQNNKFYNFMNQDFDLIKMIKTFAPLVENIKNFKGVFSTDKKKYSEIIIKYYIDKLKESKKQDHIECIKKAISDTRYLIVLSIGCY